MCVFVKGGQQQQHRSAEDDVRRRARERKARQGEHNDQLEFAGVDAQPLDRAKHGPTNQIRCPSSSVAVDIAVD